MTTGLDCAAGCGVGAAGATIGAAIAARNAADAAARRFFAFTALVSRQYGKGMTARSARDHDLKMALFAYAPRVARAVLVTAESATGRRRSFACGLLVHDTALTRASQLDLPKQRHGCKPLVYFDWQKRSSRDWRSLR